MGLSNIEVKRMNRNNILRYMLANGSNAKNTIAAALDLSIPTVAQCLKELQEQGLVEEEGTMKSIGGRKAMAVSSNSGCEDCSRCGYYQKPCKHCGDRSGYECDSFLKKENPSV